MSYWSVLSNCIAHAPGRTGGGLQGLAQRLGVTWAQIRSTISLPRSAAR